MVSTDIFCHNFLSYPDNSDSKIVPKQAVPIGVLHSFSIKNINDKMDLRLFYFRVMSYNLQTLVLYFIIITYKSR